MAVIHVNDQNFDNAIQTNNVAIVDLWATWCGPCRSMSPILDSIAEKYDGKVAVLKLDVDDNPETAQRFNVRNIPYFLFFKNGEVVDRHVGAIKESDIEQKLADLLS